MKALECDEMFGPRSGKFLDQFASGALVQMTRWYK